MTAASPACFTLIPAENYVYLSLCKKPQVKNESVHSAKKLQVQFINCLRFFAGLLIIIVEFVLHIYIWKFTASQNYSYAISA